MQVLRTRAGRRPSRRSLLIALGLSVMVPTALRAEARRADVVVYGGTAAGAIAAVAAAREGKSVLVVEPGRHVGGMVSGGLGATDTGNRRAIGGYAREFFDRVREHYVRTYGADSPQVRDCSDGFRFEPKVAEGILQAMLAEAKVTVLFDKTLTSVRKVGPRIESIVTATDVFSGSVFLDASYEGDLLAAAGVAYTVGREPRPQYSESLAGVQVRSPANQWPVKVSPFDAAGKLLPFVQEGTAGFPGTGDRKVQAYTYRVCMTDVPENRVPFPKPPNYDPNRFELLARYLKERPTVTMRQLINPVAIPNSKTDTHNAGPFSTDHIGASWAYPDADPATRAAIVRDHLEYVQGFFYFLANDSRVPKTLHDEISRWGLPKDEFTDHGNWPHQLYVREARRMIGTFVMKQADILESRTKEDSVGLGSHPADSHHVQRVATPDGGVINEGDFQVDVSPYAIPYRSLTPQATQCVNLLVPVCVSATHVAYATIRREPVYMILGQACGVAAALAIDAKAPVQAVPVSSLQQKLRAQKAVLDPAEVPTPPRASIAAANAIDPATLEGIVVDDSQAVVTGDWHHSTSAGPFVGDGYLHDSDSEKGLKRVRFVPKIPTAGEYEVRLFYTAHPNRATNVPVLIRFDGGERALTVNQRQAAENGRPRVLGTFPFAAGEAGTIDILTERTDGHVVADAVQLVPKP